MSKIIPIGDELLAKNTWAVTDPLPYIWFVIVKLRFKLCGGINDELYGIFEIFQI